ncbi:hypothetical protein [Aestuariivita boseongensis]|uniref:hypothetical protein n=1 Tax=Aestuariivita boseongensis TaxID=1470562 RepID=UPI0006803A42|nr:hypothetical protein [Aestuariivita boseongensis]
MRSLLIKTAFVLAALCPAAVASANTVDAFVQECVARTGAQGAFAVSTAGQVPQVAAGAGATQKDAAAVNDCLLDRYQVQFAVGSAAQPTAQSGNCEALRRGRIPSSAPLGGLSAQARANRAYQECLAAGPSPEAGPGIVALDECGRGSNVFQGGSAYCRD